MKSLHAIAVFLLTLSSFSSSAQSPLPIDEKTGKTIYTEVVEISDASQKELYQRAVSWFKTYFPNPASVIKEQDSATCRIKGQHAMYIFKTLENGEQFKSGQVKYAIEIQAKDGRYKYTVDDIFKLATPKVYVEEWLKEPAPEQEARMGYVKQVNEQISGMIAKLKEAMKQPAKSDEKDEW